MVTHIGDILIEGYAISNCSTDGRAMMGIDLQSIIQIVESISELKVNSQLLKLTEVSDFHLLPLIYLLELYQSLLSTCRRIRKLDRNIYK
jgi:hypothetical protein